ncbi:RHS repeat-associated core domain-containing protein [Pseudomonas viciae]|uniref:RHS repeat-associated core domain-containing protein n=1 Tax=Pseudomonas viciae TaxID=2505979 RepID=A0A4P7PGP7_9PSED|nr:RHS repeat-associated core domain-containing protein [Pseudomonas viciae]QBZ89819.1 RHS repeat-associated core domain-containing protein [Pseudomonas viciae]
MPTQHEPSLCRYHYDPLDRLIGCTLLDEPEYQHFYCKKRLTTEIRGTIKNSIFQHDDQLLAQQRHGDKFDATLLITDCQRSVLHTHGENSQRQSIAYSPYGHRSIDRGIASLLGFNGERADPVTGHYLLGNGRRAFSPVLMRFNSSDSFSPFGEGGLNGYTYCLGDPINRRDPTGNTPQALLGLKKTYVGQSLWTKGGVASSDGFRALKRINALGEKIEKIKLDAQRQIFTADKNVLDAGGDIQNTTTPKTGIRLDNLAYKVARPETHPFSSLTDKFPKPYLDLMQRQATIDQANYYDVFKYLEGVVSDEGMHLAGALESKTLKFNKEIVASYKLRLRLFSLEEVSKLVAEQNRIRDKYLTYSPQ